MARVRKKPVSHFGDKPQSKDNCFCARNVVQKTCFAPIQIPTNLRFPGS